MKYWAFLSYSHTDKKWGDWLHKALETYRVPRRLVGKESRDGKVPERVYPIFRDREELPVSADLGSNINEALAESRYLIVICSPRSAQSRWVGEEIKTFKKLGREDRILALIVDGEPNASDGKPGFKVEDECFHEAMRYRMVDGEPTEIRSEPIAADAREIGDGKTNAKLKLLAGLLGVNYDDLKQREQERRLRRARRLVAAAVSLIAVFAALSVALFFNARAARQARDEARATLSRSDFFQAQRSIGEGKDLDALAQLAASLFSNRSNEAAVHRLTTLLAYRVFPIALLRLEHNGRVSSAQFSPDGKRLVSTCYDDHTARIWDAQTGKPLTEPMKHDDQVFRAQFSSDSRRIVTTTSGNTARVWDAETGKPLTELINAGGKVVLSSAQFSPDGKRILTASRNNRWDTVRTDTVRIWDGETGKPLTEPMNLGEGFASAEFSSNGKRILTASYEMTRVWDANTGRLLIELAKSGHSGTAHFSPDDKQVVIGSVENTAQVWDTETGKPVTGPMKHNGIVSSARYSPDGKRIATTSSDNTARIWDAITGDPLTEPMKHDNIIVLAQFGPDSTRIATVSVDTRIWNAQTGKPVTEPIRGLSTNFFSPDGKRIVTVAENNALVWDVRAGSSLIGRMNQDNIVKARFTSDGKRITTLSKYGAARMWDAETGKRLSESGKADMVASLEFSPDGKRVLVTHSDQTARIWDVETGRQLTEPMKHDNYISSAQFSRDGKRVLTTSLPGNTVQIWDAETGKPLTAMKTDDLPYSAQFSPDGKLIVITSGNTAQIWDAETGKPITAIKHDNVVHGVYYAEFSPDGKRIVTAQDATARVWDSATGKPLTEPMKHDAVMISAQFSPDGNRVVTASYDHTARVWDAQTGKPLTYPMKHGDFVKSAQFSPDGKRIVTASPSETGVWTQSGQPVMGPGGKQIMPGSGCEARVWDASTGQPLTDPMKHDGFVQSVQFSPDGKRIVTASANEARIWDLVPASPAPEWLPRLAEAIAGEHLNAEGVFEPGKTDPVDVIKEIKGKLSQGSDNDDWVIWGKWFLADRSTRTISPFSKVTVPEYAEDLIKESTRASLDEAEQLAIGNEQLLARIRKARESLQKTSKE